MGAEYAVNIKLNAPKIKSDLKGISTEISKLESRVAKLNRSTGKNPSIKQLLNKERSQLALEIKKNRQINKNLNNQLNKEKQILNVRKQSTNLVPRSTGGGGGRATGGSGSSAGKGGGVLSSALISGSFPLLFGQGLAGGAFGALGGGLGAKFGGQMGGFAGGLVATAALQIFNNTKDAINQFGAELNDPSANLDKLIVRIKDFDRSIVTSAATLKNAGLDQVAGELASVTLRQRFGAGGIDALKGFNNELSKFAQRSRDIGTQLSILVAGPLTLFFKLLNVGISDVERANKNLTTKAAVEQSQTALSADQLKRKELLADFNRIDKRLNEVVNRITELTNKEIAGTITGLEKAELRGLASGPGSQTDLAVQRGDIESQLAANKASLEDNKILLNIRKLQKEALESGAKVLQEQISLEKVKIGITQGNKDEKALAIEQKRLDIAKQNRKITIANANLEAFKRNKPNAIAEIEIAQTKLDNLRTELNLVNLIAEARIRAADPMLSRIDELNREMRKLNDTQRQAVELSKVMGTSFEDSFKGIIRGTMTVQDAFRNMLNKIADFFLDTAARMAANQLQQGLLGMFGKAFSGGLFSGGGSVGANKIAFGSQNLAINPASNFLGFADGGRPPVGRASIVGERGPELFVPDRAGTIVPNNAMGGSTSVVVNVDASNTTAQADNGQAEMLGKMLAGAVQDELLKQQRPGGILFK